MNVEDVLMLLPIVMFLLFLYMGSEELGFKGIATCLAIVGGLAGVIYLMGWTFYILVGVMALIDVVLILIIFKGNI